MYALEIIVVGRYMYSPEQFAFPEYYPDIVESNPARDGHVRKSLLSVAKRKVTSE